MILHVVLQGPNLRTTRIAVEFLFRPHVTKENVAFRVGKFKGQTFDVTGRNGTWKILDADKDRFDLIARSVGGDFFEYRFTNAKFWWCGRRKGRDPGMIISEKAKPDFVIQDPPRHNWDKAHQTGALSILDPKTPLLKRTKTHHWELMR